jgi:hypothetical protein
VFPFSQNLSKDNKKTKKWTTLSLAYTLILPNHESLFYALFSGLDPLVFPSKYAHGDKNHNLICHGLGPSSRGLGTNLKLLMNSNAQFHWTLLLGPLSKVALTYIYTCKRSLLQEPSTPTTHDLCVFMFVIILTHS